MASTIPSSPLNATIFDAEGDEFARQFETYFLSDQPHWLQVVQYYRPKGIVSNEFQIRSTPWVALRVDLRPAPSLAFADPSPVFGSQRRACASSTISALKHGGRRLTGICNTFAVQRIEVRFQNSSAWSLFQFTPSTVGQRSSRFVCQWYPRGSCACRPCFRRVLVLVFPPCRSPAQNSCEAHLLPGSATLRNSALGDLGDIGLWKVITDEQQRHASNRRDCV
jgi:hypothetical protein